MAGTSRTQSVRLELDAWVGNGACQVAGATEAVRARGRALEFSCEVPGRAIRCDFEGAEPLDTSAGEVCRTKRLPLHQGRSNILEGVAADAVVEWLDTSWNNPPVVVASRPGPLTQVTVSVTPTRALRIRRPRAAPVSLFPVVDASGKTAVMTLPRAVAGGELLIGVQSATVRPSAINFGEPVLASLPTPVDGLGSVILPAGEYVVTPTYTGDISGGQFKVTVNTGETTFFSLSREDVGALVLKVSDSLCAEATQAVVSNVVSNATGSSLRQVAEIASPFRECQYILAGLRPGRYEIDLTSRATGLKVTEVADVAPQVVSFVQLSAPVVRLFGRVTISRQPPAAGTRLMMQPAKVSDPDQMTTVALQADGAFEARARMAGPYVLRLVSAPVAGLSVTREVSLKEGYNELNWDVEGGTIKLSIKNWDRSSQVTVDLHRAKSASIGPTSEQAVSMSSVTSAIGVGENLPVNIAALELSDYVIEARQILRDGTRRVSTPVSVSLTPARLTADVELELVTYESVIKLINDSGQPVSGAQVRTVEGSIAEIEPGVFSISGQRGNPGIAVQIKAAGYTPVCKTAPANGVSTTISLRVGQPAVLRYLGRDDFTRPVGQVMPAGSDCWVTLGDFVHSLTKVSPTLVNATIQNWPGGSVPYRISASYPSTVLSPGPDGIILVQLPAK